MTNVNYKDYITSKDWLLKKMELLSIYQKQGWKISCDVCDSEHNLTVHHNSYEQLGNENLKDDGSGDIFNLELLCWSCHKKIHSDVNFKKMSQQQKANRVMEVLNILKQNV